MTHLSLLHNISTIYHVGMYFVFFNLLLQEEQQYTYGACVYGWCILQLFFIFASLNWEPLLFWKILPFFFVFYRMNFQSATALVTYHQTLMGMLPTFLMRIWIMIPFLFLPSRGPAFRWSGVYYGGRTLKISTRYCSLFFLRSLI